MADQGIKFELFSPAQMSQIATLGLEAEQQVVALAITAARAAWVTYAQRTLKTTQQTYIQGIQEPMVERRLASIALVGQLPNALEFGQDAYDMHDTLLGPRVRVVAPGSGKKGKHKKKGGGYYRVIPFRHGTPGTVGQAGVPMGNAYHNHADVPDPKALGEAIYKRASKLKASMQTTNKRGVFSLSRVPVHKTVWGKRLPAGLAPKLKAHHATDIYAGMVRVGKKYQKATQSQYLTFRTISTGSNGWMRKKTPGVHLMEKVKIHMQRIVPAMVDDFLRSATGGSK